jgi:hypothetical protein
MKLNGKNIVTIVVIAAVVHVAMGHVAAARASA